MISFFPLSFLSSFYLFLCYCHYYSCIIFLLFPLLAKVLIIRIISSALLLDGLLQKFVSNACWIWANWFTVVLPGIIRKAWLSQTFWRNTGQLNCSVLLGCGREFWWQSFLFLDQGLIQKLQQHLISAQKGTFLIKKDTKNVTTSYSIFFLIVLHQNCRTHEGARLGPIYVFEYCCI